LVVEVKLPPVLLHEYVEAPVAVRFTEKPTQIELAEALICTGGDTLADTDAVAVAVQEAVVAAVTVTL
jgi:hypothetical protein